MESYFETNNFRPKAYVGFILQKIAHLYFKEAVVYKNMRYFDFREKLIDVSKERDLATARLLEMSKACQDVGKSIDDYINRMRLLIMRAHPEMGHKVRKRILITSFQLGLRDQDLSASLAIASITMSAETERRATEDESAREHARIKKSYTNYLSTDHSEEQFEDQAAGYDPGGYKEGGEDIAAAFNEQHGYRRNAFGGRPGR